jgi:hypothetical protein
MKYYKGKYRPVNIAKYEGNFQHVEYRSSWERAVFKWCDLNEAIVKWSSEEVVVPYRCKTDNRMHRYFVDLKITFKNGDTYLIEIKPKKETLEPKKRSRTSKGYLTEVLKYVKNMSKWEAAASYATAYNWKFEVWTEETIKGLGIKLLT